MKGVAETTAKTATHRNERESLTIMYVVVREREERERKRDVVCA